MRALLATAVLFFVSLSASADLCAPYATRESDQKAISLVARHMRLSVDELCAHPRVLDIQVTERVFYNPQQQPEPHFWVTLHYNEYSCQYFIRKEDLVMTRSNCYNTW